MDKKKDFEVSAIKIYVFLFILTLFNREFLPFGIDLRYLQIGIGGYLIISQLLNIILNKQYIEIKNKIIIWTIVFYVYFLCVNIRWINNGLALNLSDFISMTILDLSNIVTILIFYLYRNKINKRYIVNCISISGIVLIISMILVWIGYTLPQIMGGDYLGYYPGVENINLFGQAFRVAGYAQDPNYASMFMIILFFTSIYFIENKIYKISMVIISLFGYSLSLSRTIGIAMIFACVYIYILNIVKDKKEILVNKILVLFTVSISIMPYLSVKLMNVFKGFFNMDTMNTRFYMWENAVQLFENNMMFGNGVTSFRSYFSTQHMGWYVHPHSTIFQLLCETGIIGLTLFIILMTYTLIDSNNYIKYIVIVFLVFCLTSELIHLSLFAFVVGVLPALNDNYGSRKM